MRRITPAVLVLTAACSSESATDATGLMDVESSLAAGDAGADVTVYFHGSDGYGAIAQPPADVVAPRWTTTAAAVTAAKRASAGRTIRAVAGYSLGRNPEVALLADAVAAGVDTVLLVDPLYDNGVTNAVRAHAGHGLRNVLLLCSRDSRAVASCPPMERALGVTACRFAGEHLDLAPKIPGFLGWRGGACPEGTAP